MTSAISPLLNVFDYTEASKASLSPVSPSTTEWIEAELTADAGACDTVIPRSTCGAIPIMPSLQFLRRMPYEVAIGAWIPNFGERRRLVGTEDAKDPKQTTVQVAHAHKALLSLSRCADMGFKQVRPDHGMPD